MESEEQLKEFKVLLKEKRKELNRVLKEYNTLKKDYDLLLYDGLSKKAFYKRKKKEAEDKKVQKLYEKSTEYEKENIENATEAEKKFKAKLKFCNIDHVFQKSFIALSGEWYIADFFLPLYNMVVEIDGGYHNQHEQKVKDRQKNKFYQDLGYIVLRITNEDANKISADDMVKYLDNFRSVYIKKSIKRKQ